MKNNINNVRKLPTNLDVPVLKVKTERNGLGVLKTLIIIGLIALQGILFIMSYLYFMSVFQYLFFLSLALTLGTCIYVISSNKNSQSKPIWILFLLVCFSFGYIMYFISNEKIFWGKNKKKYNAILERSNKTIEKTNLSTKNLCVKNDCEYLYSVGNFKAYGNTETKYFPSGTQLFDSILDDLSRAKNFIFIEFFIISEGVLLERMLSILEEKVKNGVMVKIIYDDLGSHGSLKYKTKKRIRRMGIDLKSFNKLLPKFTPILNFRDHRKIVIVDGKVGYTGGANLADEYINEKRMHGYWKDCGIRLSGDGVNGLTTIFLRQWEFVSGKMVDYSKYLTKIKDECSENLVVPFADGLEYESNIGKNVYTNMISSAKEKLYIMTPYFVIDDTINNLLVNKAKSNVDVRIILPDIADKKLVYVVSRNNAEKLVSAGVKIYTMKNSFVHSKIVLNENSAVVGSINMDLRSFYQQFESAVYLTDKIVLNDINKDIEETINKSYLIDKSKLKRNKLSYRFFAGMINLISPFM